MNYKHLYYFWTVAKAGSVRRAGERLHVTPHTISSQIGLLEGSLGEALFVRRGRNNELTDAGRLAFEYAQDIFALGAELEHAVRHYTGQGQQTEFRIGVSDAVPKTIAYHLIEPAMTAGKAVKIICREWKLDSLLIELAAHRLDLVIANSAIPSNISVRAFNHRLGESGISFFASPGLRQKLKGRFPAMLDGAPMLMPGQDLALGARLGQWCQEQRLHPRVVGEFDDSALMKTFGQRGAGIFIGPTVIEAEIMAQYEVKCLGRTTELSESFYAISVERRITHPCVKAITGAAREGLFA